MSILADELPIMKLQHFFAKPAMVGYPIRTPSTITLFLPTAAGNNSQIHGQRAFGVRSRKDETVFLVSCDDVARSDLLLTPDYKNICYSTQHSGIEERGVHVVK